MKLAWYEIAKSLIGVKELPGAANSKTIMGWVAKLGVKILGIVYKDDATPWCGVFVAYCMAMAGVTPPPIAVRAKAWAAWGMPCTPRQGAVLVFERPGGGHVGFYVAESPAAYRVLGGNQRDAVNDDTWIDKARCVAVRWPTEYAYLLPMAEVVHAEAGKLSTNEG